MSCLTHSTLSKYRKSIRAWEFGYGNAIFEIFKKKTYGKEVLLDGAKRLIRLALFPFLSYRKRGKPHKSEQNRAPLNLVLMMIANPRCRSRNTFRSTFDSFLSSSQSMGERMNKFFSVVIRRIRTWTGAARTEANEFDLIVASGFTSGLVMHCGAVMYR